MIHEAVVRVETVCKATRSGYHRKNQNRNLGIQNDFEVCRLGLSKQVFSRRLVGNAASGPVSVGLLVWIVVSRLLLQAIWLYHFATCIVQLEVGGHGSTASPKKSPLLGLWYTVVLGGLGWWTGVHMVGAWTCWVGAGLRRGGARGVVFSSKPTFALIKGGLGFRFQGFRV